MTKKGVSKPLVKQRLGKSKLLAKQHTGKIRPHKHTSYGSLAIILLLTVVPMLSASRSIAYASTNGGGSYQSYAVVAGEIPKTAPTITSLVSGQTFTTSDPVAITGKCPSNTLVKIYINEVLAGAALCQNGTYQLSINLFVGNNSVIARAYNANDVTSPDSAPVSVQLLLPGTKLAGSDQLNPIGAPAGQFFVTSEVTHRGASVGDTMTWPITIAGGQAPYAVSVSWGDGKTDLLSRGTPGLFNISHIYAIAGGNQGSYTIVIKAIDQVGSKSYMQFVAIVSGNQPAGIVGSVSGGYSSSAVLRIAWQLLAIAVIVVASFWLGEKRESKVLRRLMARTA
jgi:hypothetical protein